MLDITEDELQHHASSLKGGMPGWLQIAAEEPPTMMTAKARTDMLAEAMAQSYLVHTLED